MKPSKIKAAKPNCSPYSGSKGHLQEWRYDYEEVDPHHRHFAFYALYPSNQILYSTNWLQPVKRWNEDGGTG